MKPTVPYNKYHVLDARRLATVLPGNTKVLDTTITSPPYWNIKNYDRDGQIGFGQSYNTYLNDIQAVFAKVYDATKDTGSLWLVTDTLKENGELRLLPFDIAARLKQTGWLLQDIIVWQKDRTLPWSHQGKLRNIFEYVSLFTKSRKFKYHVDRVRDLTDLKDYWVEYPERYNPSGKAPSRSWHVAIPRQGSWGKEANYVRHACPLPSALIERMVLLTTDTNDVVLDPFAGSGAVLATAHGLGRRYIGSDLNADYKAMFTKTVLPKITKEYQEKGTADDERVKMQTAFGEAVRTLRMLKYPKEVVRLYKRQRKSLACKRVWVLPAKRGAKPRLVFEFASRKAVPGSFLRKVADLCRVTPLSKFELAFDKQVVSGRESLLRKLRAGGLSDSSQIYAYTHGRFYKWQAADALSTMIDYRNDDDSSKHPILLSPLSVAIDKLHPERFFDDARSK